MLVAGEEARSREAGENAEVAARHLVPFGAALRAGDPVGAGCGDDGDFHGPLPLAEYTLQARKIDPSSSTIVPLVEHLLLNQRAKEVGRVARHHRKGEASVYNG